MLWVGSIRGGQAETCNGGESVGGESVVGKAVDSGRSEFPLIYRVIGSPITVSPLHWFQVGRVGRVQGNSSRLAS